MQPTIPIYLQDFFRVLMLHSPIGIFMTNARSQCLFVNDRWCAYAGITQEMALGQNWYVNIHPEDVFPLLASWQNTCANGTEFSREFRFSHKSGFVQWVAVNALVLRDENGNIQGYLGNATDLNARKQNDQLKNEFVATVSHELRTPLTAIRGSLGLLNGGVAGELPEKVKPLVDIALKNCERLIRLISDILDIEKIESGKMDFKMEPVDLVALVKNTIAVNHALAEAAKINFVFESPCTAVEILTDSDKLVQVLTNLLSNACKHSPEGANVTVTVTQKDNRAHVSISDLGPGIPIEFQTRIFQKFTQADSSDARPKGGSGLGLSISKAIIEGLRGHIDFTTEINKGTTFYFELPLGKKI